VATKRSGHVASAIARLEVWGTTTGNRADRKENKRVCAVSVLSATKNR
jgi:hypothetical protein